MERLKAVVQADERVTEVKYIYLFIYLFYLIRHGVIQHYST